jgi:LysM repeat protein
MKIKNALFLFVTLFSITAFAQPSAATKEVVNGKKYYVHIVASGNTVYGLQKLYKVNQDDILKSNPGIEKGLSIGQKLYIPVPLVTVNHVVQAKETLYGIAKRYWVSSDSITKDNPTVSSGLKIGQQLVVKNVDREVAEEPLFSETDYVETDSSLTTIEIPVIQDSAKVTWENVGYSPGDKTIKYTVMEGETFYSIGKRFMVSVDDLKSWNNIKTNTLSKGTVLTIKVSDEIAEEIEFGDFFAKEVEVSNAKTYPSKDSYKIALLLPFFLDKGTGYSESVSTLAAEFYMGAQMALDTLEKLGLNAELHVYDVRSDSLTLKSVLNSDDFKNTDLVFGPIFADHAPVVARWCNENNARMVCPAQSLVSILKNNPHVYQAVPSDATLMKGMAEYLLGNHSDAQLVLIKSTIEKDLVLYESFRDAFNNTEYSGARPKLIEATAQNFKTFIKSGKQTIVIYPTTDKQLASSFINTLVGAGNKIDEENFSFYATKDWVNFDDIKATLKNKYNFHYASPNDLNYSYSKTEAINKAYRVKFNADLTKMAVQGYDAVLYYSANLLLGIEHPHLIMNAFQLNQLAPEDGYENNKCFIIEQEDYELINIED